MPPFTEDRWAPELGIVFSSRDGFVWASWPDSDGAVRLGRHDMVANMMPKRLAKFLGAPGPVPDVGHAA